MTEERVAAGLRRQLALRDELVRDGARQVGWKVGFGAPAALESLRIDRALVGFLLDTGLVDDGATVPLDGWRNPMFEAEIAVHAGPDGTIAGVSAAIELADVYPPPDDVEEILAGDIFTRHVILGPLVARRTDSAGVTARILVDGAEVAATDDVSRLVGQLSDVVRRTAETLAAHGEQLREGEILMTGSVFPPLAVRAGQQVDLALEPLGRLGLRFA